MAWALVFDGVNDYAQMNTPIMLTGDFDLEIKFKVYSGAGATSVVLSTQSDGAQWIGRWSTTRHLAFWNGQINFVEGFQVDTDYTYRLVRTGSSVEWFINGVSELTFTNGTTLTIPAFGKLGGASNNLFGQIEYMTISGVSNYDATNSSHAPGTPILTDFVSGNDATGVNMPTDGSAWLDLGGGGVIDVDATLGTISYLSNNTSVSLAGVVDVSPFVGSIGYSSNSASVSLNGSVDVVAALGSIDYSSNNTQISVTGDIDVISTLGSINYSSLNTDTSLTSEIDVPATLGSISYSSNGAVVNLAGTVEVNTSLGQIIYSGNPVVVSVGDGQSIGNVTASFAGDIYTAGFKPDTITVKFN